MSKKVQVHNKTNGIEDFYWALDAPVVQQHQGKLVVVHNKRIVAVGTNRQELVREASAQEGCEPEDLVVMVVPRVTLDEIPR
jgi:hypothetical protein